MDWIYVNAIGKNGRLPVNDAKTFFEDQSRFILSGFNHEDRLKRLAIVNKIILDQQVKPSDKAISSGIDG